MRITGGDWASRRLHGPRKGQPIRPTPDALRERAFAVLGPAVEGAGFLDLFAGTGAVGIEALSRGARRVVFVDSHRAAAAIIARNLEALALDRERWRLVTAPAGRALPRLARQRERVEIAWADPPFERWADGLEALGMAWRLGILAPDGTACLECPPEAVVPPEFGGEIEVVRELPGGASRVLLLRRRG